MKRLPNLLLAAMMLMGIQAHAQQPPRGKQVFDTWCSGCHKPLGPYVSSVAGTVVLERRYKGAKPGALEQRTDLTASLVTYYVRHGVKFMPFFRKTEINDADMAALAAYLAKSN